MSELYDLWSLEIENGCLIPDPPLPIFQDGDSEPLVINYGNDNASWADSDRPFQNFEYQESSSEWNEHLEPLDIKFDPVHSVEFTPDVAAKLDKTMDELPTYLGKIYQGNNTSTTPSKKKAEKKSQSEMQPPRKRMYELTLEECSSPQKWTQVKRAINTKRFHDRRKSKEAAAENLLERFLGGKALGRKGSALLQEHFPKLYDKYIDY